MQWLKSSHPFRLRVYAGLVLFAVAVLMGWGVSQIRHLNTKYSMSQFMPKEHPLFRSDRLIKQTFGLGDEEPIIVNLELPAAATGTWLEPARIAELARATDALAGIDGIHKALSLANVETAENANGAIQVDKVLSLVPAEKWRNRVLNDPLLSPGLVSRDGRVVTLVGEISSLSEQEVQSITSQIRARVGEVAQASGVKVMVSGVIPLQSQMTALMSRELVNFFGLAFLVCFITLVAYFRSFSTVGVCLALVLIANIATFASLAVLGIPFSVLSSALPIICSIEALAIGSHTMLIFGDQYRQAMLQPSPPSKAEIVWSTYRSLLFPNFLMSTTTVIGFATLVASQVPLIRQFSQSVSLGIFVSCVCMSLALPSLMYLCPVPVARSWTGAKARWALWVIHHRRLVLGGVVALVALFAVNGLRLNWAVRLYDDLPRVGDIKTSADLIDQKLGGMIPLEVMVRESGEENPWNDPVRMKKVEQILTRWRANPAVGSAIGLPDLLKVGFTAANSRRSIAETLFLYGFSGADNPAARFLSGDGNATRLMFRMKDVNADQMKDILAAIESDVRATFPEAEVFTGGMAALVHPLNAELSSDLIFGLWHSLLLISVLLMIVFRSARLACIAAIPNLLPPLALLATMAYLKTPVKPVVAIIFSIALGLAYNNTVFLLTRLKKVQARFQQTKDVIMRTWYQEGNPCLFSSLAVIGGFAVFLASYFSPNRTFGAYMLWSIIFGLVGDLIVLPALLRVFPWFILNEEPSPVLARSQTWSRNFLVLFALISGMGPSAAAAAENVVHSPFVLTMKKEAFGPLLFESVIAKSTVGEGTWQLGNLTIDDPMHVEATGLHLHLKYAFNAPQNPKNPAEWQVSSRSLTAELTVDRIEAHQVVKQIVGDNEIEVHYDGVCTNVKFALPAGQSQASGRLTLGAQGGFPRLVLENFSASWGPASWQAVSMDCQGPQGFGSAMAHAASQRLGSADPYLGYIQTALQEKLDTGLHGPIALELGNPVQPGQTLRLNAPPAAADRSGNLLLEGDAYFYFDAKRGGCGAEIRDFASAPKTKSGETALFLPFAAVKALAACAHADGSLAIDGDTRNFAAFRNLQKSYFAKSAVWPDLNNFGENDVFKFHGVTSSVPALSGERASGNHAFTAQLQQNVAVTMYAPRDGKYVSYVNIAARYAGPVTVSVAGGRISLRPAAGGQLSLNGDFADSYVNRYHPRGNIDWSRIQPEAQKALLAQGWSFSIPTYGITKQNRLVPRDGDLQGETFRMGFDVTR